MYTAPREIFEYFASFVNFEKTRKQTIREYRLDRMRALLNYFDNPHHTVRCIHIAGSKGKGSTALYLARALTVCGYKTGLYASPHVADYRERISCAGDFFPDALYLQEGKRIIAEMENLRRYTGMDENEPTAFELFTLLAFLIYRAAGCNMAVIETGIGGRLDATNVIDPIAVLITPVELEHTNILGNTIPEVAAEKAGIIKPEVPVFAAAQRFPEARRVLEEHTARQGGRFFFLPDLLPCTESRLTRNGTVVSFRWKKKTAPAGGNRRQGSCKKSDVPDGDFSMDLSMLGNTQAENAGLALLALKVLQEEGIIRRGSSSWPGLRTALFEARLPGRMEIMGSDPPVILDGAHTPVSLSRTVEAFGEVFGNEGICIFGSVEGKDAAGMAAALTARINDIIISTPGTFKQSNPDQLFELFHSFSEGVRLEPKPADALREALRISGSRRPILVTGSFYMVAELRHLLMDRQSMEQTEVV